MAAEPARLTIVDEAGATHVLTADDLAKLPRQKCTIQDREQNAVEYEGVALSDVLGHCGVVLGKDLRGPRVASYVLLEATDNYRVVLGLVEVDPATTDKPVLVVDRRNGEVLPADEAPWRLVMPDDKRPVRWVRMLKRISVRNVPAE